MLFAIVSTCCLLYTLLSVTENINKRGNDMGDRELRLTEEILEMGRSIIDEPHHWTKNGMAKDIDWNWVETMSDRAFRFCSTAAILKASTGLCTEEGDDAAYDKAGNFLNASAREIDGSPSFVTFNDSIGRKHSDILRMFDSAILAVKKKIYDSKLEETGMADYFKSMLKNRKCECGSNATVLVGNGYKCRRCATAYARTYTDTGMSDRESI